MKDQKNVILKAAHKSFSLFGFKATTIDQVARMAGVGKGTIYLYFDSKEELLVSVMADFIDQMKERALSHMDSHLDFLDNLFLALFNALRSKEEQQILFRMSEEVREMGTEAARLALVNVRMSLVKWIQEQLDEAIACGWIRPCSSEIIALILYETFTAYLLEWDQETVPLNNEKILTVFNKIFVTGLSKS